MAGVFPDVFAVKPEQTPSKKPELLWGRKVLTPSQDSQQEQGDYCSPLAFGLGCGEIRTTASQGWTICVPGRGMGRPCRGWACCPASGLFSRTPSSPGVSTTASWCGWDSVGAMEDRGAPWASGLSAKRRSWVCDYGPELLWVEECR